MHTTPAKRHTDLTGPRDTPPGAPAAPREGAAPRPTGDDAGTGSSRTLGTNGSFPHVYLGKGIKQEK